MRKASPIPSLLLALAAAAVSGAAPPAVPASAADSLLPSALGPLERALWSERGLVRRLGMPLTEENREKEVHLRRGLLTAHQAGGFLTLGLMTATAITGQQILDGRDDLGGRKDVLVAGTLVSYFTTALLAMAAPPPMIRRRQWNSISWHKALAVVHFTGMVATPLLGLAMGDDEDRRRLHQYAGYATLAAFAGAMVVVTF